MRSSRWQARLKSLRSAGIVLAYGAPVAAVAAAMSLNVVVSVTLVSSSGACGTAPVGTGAVSVACVPPGGGGGQLPGLPGPSTPPPPGVPVPPPPVPGWPAGPPAVISVDGSLPTGAPDMRRVVFVPGSAIGTGPISIYAGGVDISGWRTVSFDNGTYVELTISW